MKNMLQKIFLLMLCSCYAFTARGDDRLLRALHAIRALAARENVPFSLLVVTLAFARGIVVDHHMKKSRLQPHAKRTLTAGGQFPRHSLTLALGGGVAPWIILAAYNLIGYHDLPRWIIGYAALSIPITVAAFATEIKTDKQIGAFSIPLGTLAGLALGAACGYLFSPVDTPFMQGAWNGMKYNSLSLAGYTVAEITQWLIK